MSPPSSSASTLVRTACARISSNAVKESSLRMGSSSWTPRWLSVAISKRSMLGSPAMMGPAASANGGAFDRTKLDSSTGSIVLPLHTRAPSVCAIEANAHPRVRDRLCQRGWRAGGAAGGVGNQRSVCAFGRHPGCRALRCSAAGCCLCVGAVGCGGGEKPELLVQRPGRQASGRLPARG